MRLKDARALVAYDGWIHLRVCLFVQGGPFPLARRVQAAQHEVVMCLNKNVLECVIENLSVSPLNP